MRQTLLLFVFIFLALACGAMLSFPVYKFLQLFTDIPFHKIISQLSSLCGLVFVFLYLKFNNMLNADTAGFNLTDIRISREIFTGVIMGILIMLVLETVLLLLDIHQPEPELNISLKFILIILIKAVFAGIMVAVIEEILYRGALLGGLYEKTGILNAIIVSSLVYSAVHFIKFPQLAANTDINWLTGLSILSGAFFRFSDPAIMDTFLALFAFGVLLSLIRLNKGNIFQCIGLHAGVVMSIKVITELTDYNPDNNYAYLVSKYDHLLGYLAFFWLCVLVLTYYKYYFITENTD